MTASEAKEFLRIHFNYLKEKWKPHPDYNVLEAIKFAKWAIEKQIPKKTIKIDGNWYCPKCNNSFGRDDWKSKYCGLCGQLLDWSGRRR